MFLRCAQPSLQGGRGLSSAAEETLSSEKEPSSRRPRMAPKEKTAPGRGAGLLGHLKLKKQGSPREYRWGPESILPVPPNTRASPGLSIFLLREEGGSEGGCLSPRALTRRSLGCYAVGILRPAVGLGTSVSKCSGLPLHPRARSLRRHSPGFPVWVTDGHRSG